MINTGAGSAAHFVLIKLQSEKPQHSQAPTNDECELTDADFENVARGKCPTSGHAPQ